MRNENEMYIARYVKTRYKMEVDSLTRIYKRVWGQETGYCVRQTVAFSLRSITGLQIFKEKGEALELSEYAYQCGIPTPKIIRTQSGNLMCVDGDLAFTLFEYVSGTTSHEMLSIDQMAEAGRVLGEIHRHFNRVKTERTPTTAKWLNFNEGEKTQEVDRYLKTIEHKEKRDNFDERTYGLLLKRKELLKEVPKILNRISNLTTQVIHNDYGGPNLLFKGAKLAAVIDFNPPTPFLISYEIGRVALPPENLTLSDWREKTVVLVEEYCKANEVDLKDIFFAPHMWLVQLIGSTYGVKQHYINPLELQSELDNFWFRGPMLQS